MCIFTMQLKIRRQNSVVSCLPEIARSKSIFQNDALLFQNDRKMELGDVTWK